MLTPSQRQRALNALSTSNIGHASYSLIEERIANERKCPRSSLSVLVHLEARNMG
ncbi:hypothetical protein [Nitrosomonas sp. Is37]|uniref:hypothetical protein n=1 Tax=Nitrosomonas sp. Is37 TaxID=3080535 RepID=UPI00294B874A|nr:hypothetical protein [Nitrosomonas sp. Is37]MDV6345390.1 hypothetical protein [Nitrosomonas sp. Is37]